jgi:hypothetical protein
MANKRGTESSYKWPSDWGQVTGIPPDLQPKKIN